MTASQTLHQLPQSLNSSIVTGRVLAPPHGVVTLFGYGISVRVERGHLIYKDGIGSARREARFPRVRHGLRRLIVIGADGIVSLGALRWLADQNAAFVMLDRDGSVLATTGPVRPSDARLRRAQAFASQSGAALRITRELIGKKLGGQEQLTREKLQDTEAAQTIGKLRAVVETTESIQAILLSEAQAASVYWAAWQNIEIAFPKNDLYRVPEHWLTFGTRKSPLSGSPRLAVNPPNAMLNYLYAVLESEARLALAALGLDPGLGVLHMDSRTRDSLACDLMEPIRPLVDAYVLDWITREQLRKDWFFEQRDGNCRLMGSFAVRLSESAPTWARAIAPIAEWIARTFWLTTSKPVRKLHPATRLTEGHRRAAKGSPSDIIGTPAPKPPTICRTCGIPIASGKKFCAGCGAKFSRENLIDVAKLGRVATHSRKAEALRAQTQRRHSAALKAWQPSDKPDWLTKEFFRTKIQPRLASLTVSAISSALGISGPYATDIRAGRRIPHPRHWLTLGNLAGVLVAP